MELSMVNSFEEWAELYQKLIYWELQLEDIEDSGMFEILESQKTEANIQFCKFIDKNYSSWFGHQVDAPVMSHTLFKDWIVPELQKGSPTLLVVVDNLSNAFPEKSKAEINAIAKAFFQHFCDRVGSFACFRLSGF